MEWISVKDKLPDKSGNYLILHKDEGMSVLPYSVEYKAFNTDGYGFAYSNWGITHWAHLPDPPAD